MPLMYGRRYAVALLGLLAFAAPASAQETAPVTAIDLSKPLGNAAGCVNRDKQAGGEQDSFYLTQQALVTANSTCLFVQTLTAPDGSLLVTALCSIEGEEGRSINPISIVKSASNPAALKVFDEYGALLDEVTPCP